VSSCAFSKSGRTPRRPATRQLELQRVNTCRRVRQPSSVARGQAAAVPALLGGGDDSGEPSGARERSRRGPVLEQ
jgi:hypothetical protein